MAREIAALLLLFAYASCMEMRETVERMVMVRTTGSDLQPAATGYIYKKESDGPASVTKMGESEVFEHFSKMYGKPEAYKEHIPAAVEQFNVKEKDEDKAASHANEELVKPVVEEEHDADHIDGIANENYDKMFEEYAKQFGSYKNDFIDNLHGLGHYDHGIYHGYDGGKDYGTKGYQRYGEKDQKGYGTHHDFEKVGHYHSKKHGGYALFGEGDHEHGHDADKNGKYYAHGHEYKGDDHKHIDAHESGQALDRFRKDFDKDAFKKDHDFYDGKSHEHYNNDGHVGHESNRGYKKGGSDDAGHHEGSFGKLGHVDKESGDQHDSRQSSAEIGESGQLRHGGFGTKSERYEGKSYGYEIKH